MSEISYIAIILVKDYLLYARCIIYETPYKQAVINWVGN